MKRTFTQLAIATALAITASASFAQTIPSAVENLSEKLNNGANPITVVEDPISETFAKNFSDEYVPVQINGRRYVTNQKGNVIINQDGLFVAKDGGVVSVYGEMLKIDFTGPNAKQWLTNPLDEGVAKKGDVFVFTDPTCGYCRKFEAEVPRYRASGLQVHYIPWPRTGLDPSQASFKTWARAACSDSPATAYYDIMTGNGDKYSAPVPGDKACLSVIEEGFQAGVKIGVTGTPFIYAASEDGDTYFERGYVPIDQLASSIGVKVESNGTEMFGAH